MKEEVKGPKGCLGRGKEGIRLREEGDKVGC